MRVLICLLLALTVLLSACSPAPQEQKPTPLPPPTPAPTRGPTVTPSADWKLVWSDEFDGPDGSPPDPEKWYYALGGGGWGNGEWQLYTDRVENARQEQGNLIIEARKEEYQGKEYTSARIFSIKENSWTYGRFEARAKLPIGQGIWPAIWMLSAGKYGDWPKSGEIDIMELIGKEPSTVYGTLHYGSPHELNGGSYMLQDGSTFADDYHLFAVEWEPDEIRWYADGYLYHKTDKWFTSSPKGTFPAPFDQPFHWILNVAVGGNWPGLPDETTPFPAKMYVDYVRVYQK